MGNIGKIERVGAVSRRLSEAVTGVQHDIGDGFSAKHFSEEMFGGAMDPLLMVDHFVMTAPTFDPHLHAGISAVTAMFEDTEGAFLNRDTLGHALELKAGDLYWLTAASGAAHEEKPAPGARIHALQIFVNLPERLKKCPARSLQVDGATVPVIEGEGHRVRVVLGATGAVKGETGTPEEMTLLDGFLAGPGHFVHPLPEERQAWAYAVSGRVSVRCGDEVRTLDAGTATAIEAGPAADLAFEASAPAHFVLLAGKPIRERFVKHGPLVMSTADDVRRTLVSYAQGKFGRIPS
ncbi:pirin-like C-terminal cupin domain-containing protein [Nitrospirillum sp. BR 11164]|uniref:pirin family protein n=1 Tax=Nitrospirillum sp. BR 11164 TaxID=3104324 RepID=UPI002AFF6065|nr:pirin-like C-terminal cupin domain-containing protein [Nitrospirillum sp. BR 11164]MEA1648000.1 pirin-like C-terminal cupin domain-containing protein [Nitrospirillum sp. BR 11164]